MTYLIGPNERRLTDLPPLRALVSRKAALSAHKPGVWLIRAWCPGNYSSRPDFDTKRLLGWVLHYTGRFDLTGIEWWGFTYTGLPSYMDGRYDWSSGLTIQHYVEPTDKLTRDAQAEGRVGCAYGKPETLEIPESGVVQR